VEERGNFFCIEAIHYDPVERTYTATKPSRQPYQLSLTRPLANHRRVADMKSVLSMFGLLAVLVATIGLSTVAADKTMTWTGWISDSHCGAKGMSADHAACAQTCVKTKGASWVFVSSKTKKVYAINNQDAVDADAALGHAVKVTGHLESDGTLHVDKIAAAAAAAPAGL
jgi:hypothetical protein